MMFNLRHIGAVTLRHWYVIRHSPPEMINGIGWPIVNVLLWGFMNHYLSQTYGGQGYIGGSLLMGAVFWDVFMRSSWGMTGGICVEFEARNLGSLFSTPMNQVNYIASCVTSTILKAIIAFTAVTIVVWLAFDFSVFIVGWHLLIYLPLLAMFGWAVGLLLSSMLFVWGLRAEPLCWFTPMIFACLMAPYYPVSALPPLLQDIAMTLPPTLAFEAMRTDLAGGMVDWSFLWISWGLGIAWFALAVATYRFALEWARTHGRILFTAE